MSANVGRNGGRDWPRIFVYTVLCGIKQQRDKEKQKHRVHIHFWDTQCISKKTTEKNRESHSKNSRNNTNLLGLWLDPDWQRETEHGQGAHWPLPLLALTIPLWSMKRDAVPARPPSTSILVSARVKAFCPPGCHSPLPPQRGRAGISCNPQAPEWPSRMMDFRKGRHSPLFVNSFYSFQVSHQTARL